MSRSGQPPDLKKYMDKKLQIKLNANRVVIGTLRGFDQFMNLVVDNTVEVNGDERNDIGMVVIAFAPLRFPSKSRVYPLPPPPPYPSVLRHGSADQQEAEVRRGWRVPRGVERDADPRARGGRLRRRRDPGHPHAHRDHHPRHPHAERPRREGSEDPGADVSSAEALQLSGRQRGALRREGHEPRPLRRRSGRVPPLQAPRRPRCPKGMLWCTQVCHGKWCEGL
ncbi:hypothetical protein ACQ4PT_006235 [Festuca glaucescens]